MATGLEKHSYIHVSETNISKSGKMCKNQSSVTWVSMATDLVTIVTKIHLTTPGVFLALFMKRWIGLQSFILI